MSLISVEPELESRVYVDPTPPSDDLDGQTEGVIRDAFTKRCWVSRDPPDDRLWALDAMRIPQAWQLTTARGEGVIIAQPDTGIAAHADLNDARLRLDMSNNLVEGGTDPVDPLRSSAANPGHGTATASVIISPDAGAIHGAAPGAALVPIRCVDDVKIFEASPVTAAINHARTSGCHVITMSLGGIPSRAMEKGYPASRWQAHDRHHGGRQLRRSGRLAGQISRRHRCRRQQRRRQPLEGHFVW